MIGDCDLYDRLALEVDISTADGAWHYATILARLVLWHARALREKLAQTDLFMNAKPETIVPKLKKWAAKPLPKKERKKGETSKQSVNAAS